MNSKDTAFYPKKTLLIGGSLMDLSSPKVMGIINATPDSFYDGGKSTTVNETMNQVNQMIQDGVDIIDVGGYSTRPKASEVSLEEEKERVVPVIRAIRERYPEVPISIDTFRSEAAKAAVLAGANIVNDVSGGNLDSEMFKAVANLHIPYILMHMRGTPATMQGQTSYEDLMVDVVKELSAKVRELRRLGVNDVLVDPGFGFAKTIDQNYEMLRKLSYFEVLDCPLLIGVSRKSMIYKVLGTSAVEALNGTSALNMAALLQGASILRVHDVKEAKEVVTLFNKMIN